MKSGIFRNHEYEQNNIYHPMPTPNCGRTRAHADANTLSLGGSMSAFIASAMKNQQSEFAKVWQTVSYSEELGPHSL